MTKVYGKLRTKEKGKGDKQKKWTVEERMEKKWE